MLASNTNTFTRYPVISSTDIDLAGSVDTGTVDHLINLYNQYHILILQDQNLNEEQLIDIGKLFGEPAQALVPTFRLKDYPVITRHTNTKDLNNTAKGVVAPEFVFHADSYFTSNPTKATLFYCLVAPNLGGETHFVNMCDVYDSLDQTTREFISDKYVAYKNAFVNQPPVKHPMVRTHPISGKKALFVNKHRALSIDGIGDNEALKLVEKLYSHATSPDFVYKHKWRKGDLLIWNNVTTMHSATPIPDTEERLLYRILTKGDLPVT